MTPIRMRNTVQGLMMASAALAIILGIGLEGRRQTERYRYCLRMAGRHSAWIARIRSDRVNDLDRIRRLDAVVGRLANLGPRPLDELVAGSGDPAFTAWFVKGRRRGLLTDVGAESLLPRELISHIEHFWGRGWRDTAEAIRRSLAEHIALEQAYRFAATRPWVAVPPDSSPQALD